MMQKYIVISFILFAVTSCGKSNSEVVAEGKEFLKDHEWFLIRMIDEIQKMPNLNNKEHTFITYFNYRNEKWNLRYVTAQDQNDTLQIENAVVSKWISSGLLRGFEYDIINQTAYFYLFIENKNARPVSLVYHATKKINSVQAITDTSEFDDLRSFKYEIDKNWLLVSLPDLNAKVDPQDYKDVVLYNK